MSKRLLCKSAILAALFLGSCDDLTSRAPSTSERLDYAELNIRNAARASSAMVDRVERLERRVELLEGELRRLR